MLIERITDAKFIKSCVTHPQLWRFLADDGSGERELYEPLIGDQYYWLCPVENTVRLGVFFVHPHNYVCYEVHTCLLPTIWGRSVECTKPLIEWVFEKTPCKRLITSVPEYNLLALHLAEDSGLIKFGLNPNSYSKNGKLYAQVLLGISKEN